MMETSLKRQKQTHILSKLRRPASSTARHSIRLSRTRKKRLTIISLGVVTSLSIPALAFASQQHLTTDPSHEISLSEQETQIEKTSSPTEEVFSSSSVEMHVETIPEASDKIVGHATINGETIPLTDGSVTTRHLDNDGNSVDVDIAISNDDSSASISSSSSTEIHIESYSSTDDEINHTRGSPRR